MGAEVSYTLSFENNNQLPFYPDSSIFEFVLGLKRILNVC